VRALNWRAHNGRTWDKLRFNWSMDAKDGGKVSLWKQAGTRVQDYVPAAVRTRRHEGRP
jgi:hypothetical protein